MSQMNPFQEIISDVRERCFKMLREILVWTDKKYHNQWFVDYPVRCIGCHLAYSSTRLMQNKNARSADKVTVGQNKTGKCPKRKKKERNGRLL